jgi:predicted transposase YbfD/YdcC
VAVSHVAPVSASSVPELAGAAGVAALVALFDQVADPRKRRGVRHRVASVLTVTVFAVLTGAGNYRQIGDAVADLPQELLALAGARLGRGGRRQAPSEATIRRIVQNIDPAAADALVGAWIRQRAGVVPAGTGVAIDGKTVRNSEDRCGDVRLFSALRHDTPVVIAQVRVPADTTETTQVGALVDPVDLAGAVITADAAHTAKATAAHLVDTARCDYVLAVKANQPALLGQVTAALPLPVPGSHHHLEVDRSHGRIVHRAIWTAPATGVDFPHAATVFRIRRDTCDTTGQRLRKQVVHGVTSLPPDTAPDRIAGYARTHWAIENHSHWVRDTVYREDHQHAYTGGSAQTMAVLRNLALALLRLAGHTRITRTLQHIAADRMRILPVLAALRL